MRSGSHAKFPDRRCDHTPFHDGKDRRYHIRDGRAPTMSSLPPGVVTPKAGLHRPEMPRNSPQQAREAAVGQHLSAGLAAGAVVRLVVGIADALDFLAAARARKAEAAMHGHLLAKSSHLLRESDKRFGAQPV